MRASIVCEAIVYIGCIMPELIEKKSGCRWCVWPGSGGETSKSDVACGEGKKVSRGVKVEVVLSWNQPSSLHLTDAWCYSLCLYLAKPREGGIPAG